jgi:hypothetical protein
VPAAQQQQFFSREEKGQGTRFAVGPWLGGHKSETARIFSSPVSSASSVDRAPWLQSGWVAGFGLRGAAGLGESSVRQGRWVGFGGFPSVFHVEHNLLFYKVLLDFMPVF